MPNEDKPVEDKKSIWALLLLLVPLFIGIAIVWGAFYFFYLTSGTWMEGPVVITAATLILVDFIFFDFVLGFVRDYFSDK